MERERERCIHTYTYVHNIYVYMNKQMSGKLRGNHLCNTTRLVSNSAPAWSSRRRVTACRFECGKSLGRNAIRIEPN